MNYLKKYILCFVVLLISIPSAGQQTITVGYGETFETIANKYEVRISDLRAANPGKDVCYAGMEIVVPQPIKSPIGDHRITSIVLLRADSMLLKAKELSNSGKHKKAIKIYNKVLDMKVRTPYAYAGLGECYFGLNKYKDARKNLNMAICSDELASVEKEWCKEALEDVEKQIEAKRQRRNAVWSKVGLSFLAAAAVTATAYAASEQSKMQNSNYQRPATHSGGTGTDHLRNADQIIAQSNAQINQMRAQGTAQLNMITQNAMNQAAQVKQRMDQAFKEEIEWRGEYAKNNGRRPTEYEVDQWYAVHYPDLLESRIMARGKMYGESQEKDKKEKTGEDDRYKTDYKEKFENRYSSGKDCVLCFGSGKCKTCNGKGWFYNPLNLSNTVSCPNCDHNHNGKCSHCHGTGKNP